jgi:hypothetical protein
MGKHREESPRCAVTRGFSNVVHCGVCGWDYRTDLNTPLEHEQEHHAK